MWRRAPPSRLRRRLRAAPAHTRWSSAWWIRVGGVKKKLKEHPGKEKELWLVLARLNFEKGIAAQEVTGDEVLALLDYPKYFELSGQGLPAGRSGILERLGVDRLIVPRGTDIFDITNLGAILFAKQLSEFGTNSERWLVRHFA